MRAHLRPRLRSRAIAALIVGAAVGVIAGGGAAAYAYWTAKGAATSSVTTQRTAVELAGPTAPTTLGTTFRNDTVDPLATGYPAVTRLAYAAPVTVRNSGASTGDVTVQIAAVAGTLPSLSTRQIWQLPAGTTTCSATTAVGTLVTPASAWNTAASFTISSMAAGVSRTYCVRTTVDSRISSAWSATGSNSFQPSITASINASGWVASATPITVTYDTKAVFPTGAMFAPADPGTRLVQLKMQGAQNMCMDVNQTSEPRTNVNMYTCGSVPQFNQTWRLDAIDASGTVVTLQPVGNPSTRLAVISGAEQPKDSTTLRLATAARATSAQQFEVQKRPNNSYQFVSKLNGKCVGQVTSGALLTLMSCEQASPGTTVEFTRTASIMPTMQNGLVILGLAGFGVDLGMTRTSTVADSLKLWYKRDTASTWVECGSVTTTSGAARPGCAYPAGGILGTFPYNFRVTDSTGSQVLMTFDASLSVVGLVIAKSFGSITNVRSP